MTVQAGYDALRAVMYIDATNPRTEEQWGVLKSGMRQKPLCAAILQAARAQHEEWKLIRYSQDMSMLLGDFEVAKSAKTDLITLLDSECAARGITGNNRVKFEELMTAYCREVAVGAGYTPQQAQALSVVLTGYGDRYAAIAQSCAAMVAMDTAVPGTWEPML